MEEQSTGHIASQRLTWHCAIRNTTGVELDDDWFELTREVLNATGIEPDDDPAACRWAALRYQANGLDIVANVPRQDGRWARLHNDVPRALNLRGLLLRPRPRRAAVSSGVYHPSPAGPNRGFRGSSLPDGPTTRAPVHHSPSR
ncbi:hypothetical protein [Streptomyces sp. 11x1]|uniref:hypothetical protein n=1 Tax=Streptomyces sp. 11x1 TaxID=3038642 RepID=UPI00292F58F1|nr:hypothetical protein [Streptomyces sp. 11x1]WNZ12011.1 hypothetical protein P8T65_33620 [Streptomyces sp. 11x1]